MAPPAGHYAWCGDGGPGALKSRGHSETSTLSTLGADVSQTVFEQSWIEKYTFSYEESS